MVRLLAPFAAALAVAIGAAHVPPAQQHRPPQTLHAVVEVLCNGELAGLAAPVSASSAVTAAHVINDCTTIGWRTTFKAGRLLPLQRGKNADWAVLLSEGASFDTWYTLAKREPDAGEQLWWWVWVGDPPQKLPFSGLYVGEATGHPSGRRFMYLDGVVFPGTSGSPIVNGAGELVGIGANWYFPAPMMSGPRAVGRAVPIHEVFR